MENGQWLGATGPKPPQSLQSLHPDQELQVASRKGRTVNLGILVQYHWELLDCISSINFRGIIFRNSVILVYIKKIGRIIFSLFVGFVSLASALLANSGAIISINISCVCVSLLKVLAN